MVSNQIPIHRLTLLLVLWLGFFNPSQAAEQNEQELIHQLMDDFHHAADQGDAQRYLSLFAEDAVFMGTDDWERWPVKEFTDYVHRHFKDGKGWSYEPVQRYVQIAPGAEVAWIDEIVESEKWGRFRGTAVILKQQSQWQIAHYSLSILVPNEVWEETSRIATQAFSKRGLPAGSKPEE